MIMFGSFLPSLLVGFSTTNSSRAWEPTLSWNQLHSMTGREGSLLAKGCLAPLSDCQHLPYFGDCRVCPFLLFRIAYQLKAPTLSLFQLGLELRLTVLQVGSGQLPQTVKSGRSARKYIFGRGWIAKS